MAVMRPTAQSNLQALGIYSDTNFRMIVDSTTYMHCVCFPTASNTISKYSTCIKAKTSSVNHQVTSHGGKAFTIHIFPSIKESKGHNMEKNKKKKMFRKQIIKPYLQMSNCVAAFTMYSTNI